MSSSKLIKDGKGDSLSVSLKGKDISCMESISGDSDMKIEEKLEGDR